MFGKLFGKKQPDPVHLSFRINARLQPIQRGYFEDPLDDHLKAEGLGEVMGGGTELADEPMGIAGCDIEVMLTSGDDQAVAQVVDYLEYLGAPKGSILRRQGHEPQPFGQWDGLAIYLDGTGLADEVYENNDINETVNQMLGALAGISIYYGHWQGAVGLAMYFYGPDFAAMKAAVEPVMATDPLCENGRIEQIA